jgi:hypothetical protein
MTHNQDDFSERLRRALHAAADPVEPAGDGLDRIRSRVGRPRPALAARIMEGYSAAARLALGGWDSFMMWLRELPGAAGKLSREVPATRWARAHVAVAAALGVVALIVAMGIFAATPFGWQTLSGTATGAQSRQTGENGGRGGGTVDGHGQQPSPVVTQPGAASSTPGPGPTPNPCQTPTAIPSPWASPAPTACASASASPLPSVTPTPAVSPSPSASPSPAGTSGPSGSPSPSESSSPPESSPTPSESSSPPESSPSPDDTTVASATPSASAPPPPVSVPAPPVTLWAVSRVFPGNTHVVLRALACVGEHNARGKRCHGGRGGWRRERDEWPVAGHRPGAADPPGRHRVHWGPARALPHGLLGLRWYLGHLRGWERRPGW